MAFQGAWRHGLLGYLGRGLVFDVLNPLSFDFSSCGNNVRENEFPAAIPAFISILWLYQRTTQILNVYCHHHLRISRPRHNGPLPSSLMVLHLVQLEAMSIHRAASWG